MLANWFDLEESDRAQFERWHNHEHVRERLEVPGFTHARRYSAVGPSRPGQGWLMIYAADTLQVFASDAYAARRAAPTSATIAARPLLRRMTRTAYDIQEGFGAGHGGFLCVVRADSSGTSAQQLDTLRSVAYGLRNLPDVASWQLGVPDSAVTHYSETDKAATYPCALYIDTTDPDNLNQLADGVRMRPGGSSITVDLFRLTFMMSRDDF
ncbi:DUF4286 family protein [Marinovum algicola]|uniref:DUF4286 family protein n=1 Tax=Marinovum algicola TaxID=42444 RepID=UPI0011142445|nr:DUF4286 family protein [Marinovum algicola]